MTKPVKDQYFLVIVDTFPNLAEILLSGATSSNDMISLSRQVFAQFRMPETLVSDNGTQFTPDIFKAFC